MKKTSRIALSVLTGLIPSWLIGYKISTLIKNLTSSTQVIGNRRMLFYLHPILQLVIAAFITGILIWGWHTLVGRHLDSILIRVKELKINKPNINITGNFFKSFFTFGYWRAESIVQFIFYFGIILVGLQFLNLFKIILFDFNTHDLFGIPSSAAITGLFLVLISLVGLLIWKCVCEILLIILRAFEVYYYKTIAPEGLDDYVKNITPNTK